MNGISYAVQVFVKIFYKLFRKYEQRKKQKRFDEITQAPADAFIDKFLRVRNESGDESAETESGKHLDK